MRFLAPVGGLTDARFGILTSFRHRGVPAGVRAGLAWGGDNAAYTGGFDPTAFLAWLAAMEGYRATCLFIAVPDVCGDAEATAALFGVWAPRLTGWPLAYVAQDGQENRALPAAAVWAALFIGGTTAWKLGAGAVHCIEQAQALGKRVHVGRVNYGRRYRHFAAMAGSQAWTCDGTRTRYEGVVRTLAAWAGLMAEPVPDCPLPECDCGGQPQRGGVRADGECGECVSVDRAGSGDA